jgi:hypothetical protein
MKASLPLQVLRYFSILAFQLFSIFPLSAILDTNTNGMSDLWEKQHNNGNLYPATFIPTADPDQDGWNNATEAAAGTDPHNANSPGGHTRVTLQPTSAPGLFQLTHPTILGKNYQLQGSYDLAQWYNISDAHLALENQHTTTTGAGLTDGTDAPRYFWRTLITDADTDLDSLSNTEEHTLNTNPYHNDTDNDGILDKAELTRNLNPLHYDTDNDRLPDAAEDTLTTNPADPDTDADTLSDGDEVAQGTNPLLADTDGDGLTDAQEKTHRTDPLLADTDGDTHTDSHEITNGTDPLRADTDNDGIPDGTDPAPLTNEIQNDPDGYNLPTALNTVANGQLRARWDFHHLNTTPGLGLFKAHPSITNLGNILTSNTTATDAVITSSGIQTRYPTGMPHACAHLLQVNSYLKLPNGNYPVTNGANWSFWIQFQKNILHSDPAPRTLIAFGKNAASPHTTMVLHAYIRPPTSQEQNNQDFTNKLVVAHNNGAANTVTFPLPDDLDDGQWQHLSLAYGFENQGRNYHLTINGGPITTLTGNNINQATLVGTSGILPYIMIGKFHHNISSTSPAILKPLAAKIDRLRIYGRKLTTTENLALYNHNLDNDSLPDRTENTTAYWRDTTPDNLSDGSEIFYTRSPYQWEPADADSDGDGIDDATEIILGTHLGKADSDGDLMPDGWEYQNGLDPLNPNDAALDPDNDGLTNINEYRHTTNPRVADTDGDGKTDGAEAKGPDGNLDTDDGSNPADPSDEGNRPPADQLITLTLGVGDNSASHSEDYVLNVFQLQPDGSEKRIYTLRSGGVGQYKDETKSFPRNHSYSFQIDWQGTNNQGTSSSADPEGADFDYDFIVQPLSGNESHTLIDAYDPRDKTVDNTQTLRGNRNNITDFPQTHEPKRVVLLRAGILVDANRDGQFSQADEGKITQEKPWRFWVNEDNDNGETGGKDMPVNPQSADYADSRCNGIRDLVDFFPAQLQIQHMLQYFPAKDYDYHIIQEYDLANVPAMGGNAGSGYMEWTEAEPSAAVEATNSSASYLRKIDTAFACEKLQVKPVRDKIENSTALTREFLNACSQKKGLLLFEAKNRTTRPIQLTVSKRSSGSNPEIIATASLPVSYTQVTKMFRYKFISPAANELTSSDIPASPDNWPDEDRNDKHFVFVHGYNVNQDQAKAWGSEIFKRMFWSGSNAKFSAFAWHGFQSQIANFVAPNYQINLVNAFASSHSLKQYIDLLPGEKTVAAHSMGNVIMGSAMHDWGSRPKNYIMLNSAAAKECYDESEATDPAQVNLMIHPWWKNYIKEVRASEWHKRVWSEGDERAKLTWRGRLKNVINNGGQTVVYNFYSEGEEVLNNPTVNDPDLSSDNPSIKGTFAWTTANKTWAMQEKRKGWGMTGVVHTSNYGGWFPNLFDITPQHHILMTPEPELSWRMRLPSEIPNSPTQTGYGVFVASLKQKPFFDHTKHSPLFDSAEGENTVGSNYAKQWANTLISEMIPCTSLAAGRNGLSDYPLSRQFDMHRDFMTDNTKWPLRYDKHDKEENLPRAWCHSDIREVAYTHVWQAFQKIVEIGNLSQK